MTVSLKTVVKNNLTVTKRFFVEESTSEAGNPMFVLTRKLAGRPVAVHSEVRDDGLWVNPPKYAFKSRISHFDFTEPEYRWTRRKDIIVGLVEALRQAEVWTFIQNKTFFAVNKECLSFKKHKGLESRVAGEFRDCLNPKHRAKKNKALMKELEKKATALLKAKA